MRRFGGKTHSKKANDDGGHGEDDGGEEQDEFDIAEGSLAVHDEVEAGVEDPALGHDHDSPGEVDEGDGAAEVGPDAEVREDDEQRLQHDAPGPQRARPEVQAPPPLEQQEQRRVDLRPDVPRDARERAHRHGHRQVLPDVGDVAHDVGGCGDMSW